jgi:hypothetical protein
MRLNWERLALENSKYKNLPGLKHWYPDAALDLMKAEGLKVPDTCYLRYVSQLHQLEEIVTTNDWYGTTRYRLGLRPSLPYQVWKLPS